jgi:hypothetical protein
MRSIGLTACLFLALALHSTADGSTPQRLNSKATIPTLAWMGVPQELAKADRFREMKEAGISISFTGFSNLDAAVAGLDEAEKGGATILVSCPEILNQPEAAAKRLMSHPALFGYFLGDEPGAGAFPGLGAITKRIAAVDPKHPCYENLYPNYAPTSALQTKDYPEHLAQYLEKVPTPFLSFDFYPIQTSKHGLVVRPLWYENLEQVAAATTKAKRPFWAFALSTQHFAYPQATVPQLRLQLFSNLAYGAQGLEYFTYWQPGEKIFVDAPIDRMGNRTVVYDRIKQVNAEVQGLAGVFLGSHVVAVGHTGETIPQGTRRYEPQPPVKSVSTGGGGAVVSLLEGGDGARRFLVVVNRDVTAATPLSVALDDATPCSQVDKDGTLHPLAGRTFEATLDPGDVAVLTWNAKDGR